MAPTYRRQEDALNPQVLGCICPKFSINVDLSAEYKH